MWQTYGDPTRPRYQWRQWATRDEISQDFYSTMIRRQWLRKGARVTPDDVLQVQLDKLLTYDVAQKLLTRNAADHYMNLERARKVTRCERCIKLFSTDNEVRFTRIKHNLAAIDGNIKFHCMRCITTGSVAPPTSPADRTTIDHYFYPTSTMC